MSEKTEIKEIIEIPENVNVNFESNILTVKGEKGEISRIFSHPKININIVGKNIEIICKSLRRKERALFGTYIAHMRNMIKGTSKGFEYQMKTVFSHFPIKTAVEGNDFIIHNFLGERSPRKAKIIEGVNIEVKGENVTVSGIDKEKIGQTVANIERATAVKYRDIRVFQDGVYLIKKGGK